MPAKVNIAALLRKHLGNEVADAMAAKIDKMIREKKSAAEIEAALQADLSALSEKVTADVSAKIGLQPSQKVGVPPPIKVGTQPSLKVSPGPFDPKQKTGTSSTGPVPAVLRKGPK